MLSDVVDVASKFVIDDNYDVDIAFKLFIDNDVADEKLEKVVSLT